MKPILVLCLLSAATTTGAEQLYRCVGPQPGQVSYQSATCPAGTRSVRSISYEPDPPPRMRPGSSARAPTAATAPATRRAGRGAPGARRADDPCRQAKAWRDRELERLGLKRRFDDLSRIDARVRAACKGY